MKVQSKRNSWRGKGFGAALAIVLAIAASELAALPQTELVPEAEKGFTVGAVYTTMDAGYFSGGLHFQCFDRSYRRVLTRLARERGFGLHEFDLSVDPGTQSTIALELAGEGLAGVLVCETEPIWLSEFVQQLHREGIPVVLNGVRNLPEPEAPYVGDDPIITGTNLGRATATLFKERFPGERARLLVMNNRGIHRNLRLEDGIIAGFRQILPQAEILPGADDHGSIVSATEIALLALEKYPRVNVLVGTSDFRTTGIINALRNFGRGTPSTEVVASVGGSEEAMRALLDPNSAWKVEAGLAVGDMAYEGCELVRQMMDKSRPLTSNVEVLVESQILVAPSFEEVAGYLRRQHGIEDFKR